MLITAYGFFYWSAMNEFVSVNNPDRPHYGETGYIESIEGPFIMVRFSCGDWDIYFSEDLTWLNSPSIGGSPTSFADPSGLMTVKDETAAN